MKHLQPSNANPITTVDEVLLTTEAAEFIRQSISDSTLRGYKADMRMFALWCNIRGLNSLPASPNCIVNYISDIAKGILSKLVRHPDGDYLTDGQPLKASTIERRLAGIRAIHLMSGQDSSPTDSMVVKKTLVGIKRTLGTRPNRKKPATNTLIRRMIDCCDLKTLAGKRDRAILLLGFAGAFRRAALSRMQKEDILDINDVGMILLIRKDKQDKFGAGRELGILRAENPAYCPILALQEWMAAAKIDTGYVFRRMHKSGVASAPKRNRDGLVEQGITGQQIARIVKRYAEMIGEDPTRFSGHSLRRGFVTSAVECDQNLKKIMEVTGHVDIRTVVKYADREDLLKGHAGSGML